MPDTNKLLYEELTEAAASKALGSKVAEIIVRAYDAGWETGDIYEALNEGGYDLSFGLIESLAQITLRSDAQRAENRAAIEKEIEEAGG